MEGNGAFLLCLPSLGFIIFWTCGFHAMKHQRTNIRKLFERNPFIWIPVPEIAKLSLQYNSRIWDLRQESMNIINKTQRVNGETHSWFKYLPME